MTTTGADRESFMGLVHQHDRRLRGLAYRLLGGDRDRMDDAMQEAYLRAYRSLETVREALDAGGWLYRITYNACIDELRRSGRRAVPVDADSPVWDRPSPAAQPDAVVATADLARRALASLPDDQRATVVLVDGEDLDQGTAARLLGVAPGTVASRLSRARHAIRAQIGEDR